MECHISGKFVKWRPNSTHALITSLNQMHRLRVLYIVFKKHFNFHLITVLTVILWDWIKGKY